MRDDRPLPHLPDIRDAEAEAEAWKDLADTQAERIRELEDELSGARLSFLGFGCFVASLGFGCFAAYELLWGAGNGWIAAVGCVCALWCLLEALWASR